MDNWIRNEYILRRKLNLDFCFRIIIDAKGFENVLNWQKTDLIKLLLFYSYN